MSDTTTTYVGYYAMHGTTDLPVTVTADSYAHAEYLLGNWRARTGTENATADALLSADPVRIECDRHALAELDRALDRVQQHAGCDGMCGKPATAESRAAGFAGNPGHVPAGRIVCENTLNFDRDVATYSSAPPAAYVAAKAAHDANAARDGWLGDNLLTSTSPATYDPCQDPDSPLFIP